MLSYIKPIVPNLYFTTETNRDVILWPIVLLITAFAAFMLSHYSIQRFKTDKRKTEVFFILPALLMTALILYFFGFTAITLKGIILSLAFIISSFQDIKTRECDDSIHIVILIAAFIGADMTSLVCNLCAAAFVFAFLIIPVLITKKTVGGADIKIATVCTFMLGLQRGLAGLIFGLTLAVIINLIKQRENKKEGFPLIPYLAAGFMAAYFI